MTTDKARETYSTEITFFEPAELQEWYDVGADIRINIRKQFSQANRKYQALKEEITNSNKFAQDQENRIAELKAENERLRESLQWALNGDTGLSSKHLVATHFNMDAEFYSACDKGDRRRCIGAIRAISGLEDTLDIMKNKVKWAEQVPLIIEEMKG